MSSSAKERQTSHLASADAFKKTLEAMGTPDPDRAGHNTILRAAHEMFKTVHQEAERRALDGVEDPMVKLPHIIRTCRETADNAAIAHLTITMTLTGPHRLWREPEREDLAREATLDAAQKSLGRAASLVDQALEDMEHAWNNSHPAGSGPEAGERQKVRSERTAQIAAVRRNWRTTVGEARRRLLRST